MADKIREYSTSKIPTHDIGQTVDELMAVSRDGRKSFERHWYDNNFFDDGHHFRYLSRTENKIVDLSERATIYTPMRAIPKASRQIRGVANLLMSPDYKPTAYPERVDQTRFQMPEMYQQELQKARDIAKKTGWWLTNEYEEQDITLKLAQMIILASKNSVAYLKIYPDAVSEKIVTSVRDAFDIYLLGNLTEIDDSPFIIEAYPKILSEIKANENFDKKQLDKISPDNKYASSEIKEAYMKARYGKEHNSDAAVTLIMKEAFLKEYLNPTNRARIRMQDDADKILKGKEDGDVIIRHVHVAGNIWLRDRYLKADAYPFVDFRFEPGPIYQVPLIERFIPQNKSLDTVVSRLERYTHTMVTGTWLKRQGEQFEINNIAGGQIIEYNGQPPVQGQIAPLPAFIFNFIGLLNSMMEEQGVTTSTLGKLPSGVKANAAIESLKESEFANLVIAQKRLKDVVKRISEKFLMIADDYFVKPQTVYFEQKGEPNYFDVIGASAAKGRKELQIETPEGLIPLKKDTKVKIDIETGAAFTREGQKQTMIDLLNVMTPYVQNGTIPAEALKYVWEGVLHIYQFGNISEFMSEMDKYLQGGSMSQSQIEAVKVALAEVIKDLEGSPAFPTSDQRIEEGMVATAEAIKDAGLAEKQEQPEAKGPSKSMSFKDLPPEGKIQMAQQAGIQLTPEDVIQQQVSQLQSNKLMEEQNG